MFNVIIDDMKALGPTYRYHRAKCFYHMGRDYFNQARADLHHCLNYCIGKTKEDAYLLRAKAYYLSGVLEIEYGQDTLRALHMFEEYLSLYKTVFMPTENTYRENMLRRDHPYLVEFKNSSKDYLE